MYYGYVLQSQKDVHFYTGFTKDMKRRLQDHNESKVCSTKGRTPLKLIYYEACLSREDATRREKYLKTTYGKRYIKNRLINYLRKNIAQGK